MVADRDPSRSENPKHESIHPATGELIFKEGTPGEVRAPSPGHHVTPTSVARQAESPPRTGLATIPIFGALAFLLGGAGAWTYLNYLAPYLDRQQPESRQPVAQEPGPGQANLLARVDDLSGKLDQLRSRVDSLPKASPAPDIEPLKAKVSTVDELSRKVQTLEERLNDLPKRIDQEGNQIATLTARVDEVRNRMDNLRDEAGSANRNTSGTREAMKPVAETIDELAQAAGEPAGTSFGTGAELFRQKKYKEANDFFSNLVKAEPEDARAWYYAALARGFATGDWKGETERLVNRGVEREKAGTPPKSEIDSTFAGLTTETGKDWLAFFRRRAGQPAAGTTPR
jgi:TolA-binding protein